jgi:hypothetical protein
MKTFVFGVIVTALAVCAGAMAARVPGSPRLHPVSVDVRRAGLLLLTKAELPGGFQTFNTGATPSNNSGTCHERGADLSALTTTGEAYGSGLTNTDLGVDYLPSAYVFSSRAQAAQAEAGYTAAAANKCAAEIVATRLKHLPAKIRGETFLLVSRHTHGVAVRARRAIALATIGKLSLSIEASLIFFQRGRAVAEVSTSGPWNPSTRRTWAHVLTAVTGNLERSGF